MPIETVDEIAPAVDALASAPNSGLIVPSDLFMLDNRQIVIDAVARRRLPAIYPQVQYAEDGGLVSYSTDTFDLYRRAGVYLGRILNGESPAELPVQVPQKLQLVVNLRTADALGIAIPIAILAVADRVIE
jgi:putative ABC transport system substrate-binding protein